MTIPEIKSRLSILTVLSHYGLKPNKNNMLNCPFHEDKTPSMQVYPKTNTVYCFSSNCKLHGKSLDVIDLIMHQENCTKHKAILKAKTMTRLCYNQDGRTTKAHYKLPRHFRAVTHGSLSKQKSDGLFKKSKVVRS